MGSRGKEMRRLQKKLIPVNIIVCILCLVAAISMFFTPFLSVDLGKMISDDSIKGFMKEKIVEMFKGNGEDNGNNENGGNVEGGGEVELSRYVLATADGKAADVDVDGAVDDTVQEGASSAIDSILSNLGDLMPSVIDQVFEDLKGSDVVLVLSPKSMTSMAFSQSPASQLMGLVLNDDNGLIRKIVDSLVSSIKNIGNNKAFTNKVETIMIDVFADLVKEQIPEEFRGDLDEEDIKKALNELDGAKSADEAAKIFEDLLNDPENGELSSMSDEEKAVVTDKVKEIYNKTVENTKDEETGEENFSVEAMICVAASESMEEAGLGEGALDNYIKNLLGVSTDNGDGGNGEENGETPARAKLRLTEEQVGEPAPAEGEQGGNDGEQSSQPAKKAPTTYGALFSSLVSDNSETEITKTITTFANDKVAGAVTQIDEMDAQFHLFKIIAGVWIFFIGLWLILFLFAFFHMFARNKRFMTWYVKIFCPWPAIIFWLLPLLIKNHLATITGTLGVSLSESVLKIFNVVAGGISSMLWISGLCYLLLWAVMLLWAFPIKHKIRKLKKEIKMERYR